MTCPSAHCVAACTASQEMGLTQVDEPGCVAHEEPWRRSALPPAAERRPGSHPGSSARRAGQQRARSSRRDDAGSWLEGRFCRGAVVARARPGCVHRGWHLEGQRIRVVDSPPVRLPAPRSPPGYAHSPPERRDCPRCGRSAAVSGPVRARRLCPCAVAEQGVQDGLGTRWG